MRVKFQQHKAVVAAILALAVIGLGVFFIGAWAGSTGTLTFGTVTAAPAPHSPDEPCCAKPMAMDKDHRGPKMPEGMPMDKMGPKSGKDCCDK